jgi:Mechanosensitive ion channel, beta-domain
MFESFFTSIDPSILRYSLGTAFLVIVVLVIRATLHRAFLGRGDIVGEIRRRRTVNIRNALLILLIVGVILIWAPHIQTLAVSLLAIAVALAIATKELIDCISGGAVRMLNGVYSVGDRIEMGGVRGNVVDVNLLSTTILEIGPGQTSHQYTGRAMTVPNSVLLRNTVINESYSREYRLHIITVPLSTADDWKEAERILLEAANEECLPFLEKAQEHMKKLEGRTWLDAPSVEPRVTFQLPEPGRINLLLRIPCPTRIPSRLEQAILRRFLSQFRFVDLSHFESLSTHSKDSF